MRSVNLDQLRAFVEVVKCGSFTAAARELNLTQPAVTHQVQEMEKRFSVTLVERLGKRAHATEAGEKLIEHARHLLDQDQRVRASMRRFTDHAVGRVRIGTSMTMMMYALPPILQTLKTAHPTLEINLKVGLTTATLKLLKANVLSASVRCRSIGIRSRWCRCWRMSWSRSYRRRSVRCRRRSRRRFCRVAR